MRSLARTSLILGAVVCASGSLAVVAVGCGGDDTSIGQTDAQADQSADVTTDHVGARDGRSDGESTDAKARDAKSGSDAEDAKRGSDAEAGSDDASDAELTSDGASDAGAGAVEVRLELAKRYAQLNHLNRLALEAPHARLGVIASGITAHDVLGALEDLGIGELGAVRVLQIGMLYPLDEGAVRDFARDLDEILVIEEKGPFLERLVRDALYGGPSRPPVLGA